MQEGTELYKSLGKVIIAGLVAQIKAKYTLSPKGEDKLLDFSKELEVIFTEFASDKDNLQPDRIAEFQNQVKELSVKMEQLIKEEGLDVN